MQLIKPDVELWKQPEGEEGIWKHIERCTRVCYQSTKKNDNETSQEFCNRVLLKSYDNEANHGAMLEHGTVYLTITSNVSNFSDYLKKYNNNKYSRTVIKSASKIIACTLFVTTNMRVIIENGWTDDLKYFSEPTFHVRRYTFSFITNIGISRELNRHRVNSICEESTRYCNYSPDRSSHGVKFIDDNKEYNDDGIGLCIRYLDKILNRINSMTVEDWYSASNLFSNICYINLIALGEKPQMARKVLTLNTKTQVVHTAFIDDWYHFIRLRSIGVSGTPHPEMKKLADKLYSILENERESLGILL